MKMLTLLLMTCSLLVLTGCGEDKKSENRRQCVGNTVNTGWNNNFTNNNCQLINGRYVDRYTGATCDPCRQTNNNNNCILQNGQYVDRYTGQLCNNNNNCILQNGQYIDPYTGQLCNNNNNNNQCVQDPWTGYWYNPWTGQWCY